MAEFKVYNLEGEAVGSVHVEFDGEAGRRVLHQTVVALRNGQRQGTHATKGRAAVRGGGRKPYRQKGTGRARQGSRRAPQWRGGGIVHGPQPRSYAENLPVQVGRQAFRAAIAARLQEGALHVLEGAGALDGKTQTLVQTLLRLNAVDKPVLLVATVEEPLVFRAARNLSYVQAQRPEQTNVLDVLSAHSVIATRGAFDAIARRLSA